MAVRSSFGSARFPTLQATFTALAGMLLLAFLLPLLAFLPGVEGAELARQLERAGLLRSVLVSGASATVATGLAALGGVPLGYLLARDRLRVPRLIRTLVLIPLVLPPVAAGVLLLNVYGPGGLVGRLLDATGWTLANSLGGIVVAQAFITAPFVILTAEAAFRAVDPRLEAVAATLGRRPSHVFRRVSLPLARYGLLAGLALAWMRAAGEFGATVVLAYHPRSLPVHLWVELTGRGLRAALPVALAALLLAAVVLVLAQRFAARTRNGRDALALRGPGRRSPQARLTAVDVTPPGASGPGPVVDARFALRLGEFVLEIDLQAGREILSLFGPSGAGKSTLLRAIAGLSTPDSGRLAIDGVPVFGNGPTRPPNARPIGLVLQGPSLFPHLSVRENVLFGADGPGTAERLQRLVAVTRLAGLEDRYPSELSGGQQQRAALARALMRRPRVLLLDEPFSSLDTNMRERLHGDVKRIQATFGLCVIYVTHELRDACALGNRIAVIGDGRIEQVGEPLAVIRRPATYDVARFVGVRNLLEGTVTAVEGRRATVGVGALVLEAETAGTFAPGQQVHVCMRPEDLGVVSPPAAGPEGRANVIRLALRDRQLRGATFTLEGRARSGGGPASVRELVRGAAETIRLEVELPVRTYEALELANAAEVTVTVPPEAVHLIPRASSPVVPVEVQECDGGRSPFVLTAERRVT